MGFSNPLHDRTIGPATIRQAGLSFHAHNESFASHLRQEMPYSEIRDQSDRFRDAPVYESVNDDAPCLYSAAMNDRERTTRRLQHAPIPDAFCIDSVDLTPIQPKLGSTGYIHIDTTYDNTADLDADNDDED